MSKYFVSEMFRYLLKIFSVFIDKVFDDKISHLTHTEFLGKSYSVKNVEQVCCDYLIYISFMNDEEANVGILQLIMNT